MFRVNKKIGKKNSIELVSKYFRTAWVLWHVYPPLTAYSNFSVSRVSCLSINRYTETNKTENKFCLSKVVQYWLLAAAFDPAPFRFALLDRKSFIPFESQSTVSSLLSSSCVLERKRTYPKLVALGGARIALETRSFVPFQSLAYFLVYLNYNVTNFQRINL